MRKNEREGDPKGEKSISGVTEVLGKHTFKKHLNHPFTVMQPFVLQHTCTRTHTHKKKKAVGEDMGIITSTLLMTGWKNHLKTL